MAILLLKLPPLQPLFVSRFFPRHKKQLQKEATFEGDDERMCCGTRILSLKKREFCSFMFGTGSFLMTFCDGIAYGDIPSFLRRLETYLF